MTFLIRRLPGSFGAEVTSFRLRTLTQSGRARLRRALDEHLLLVFRDQTLSFDDQVLLTEIFGDLDDRVQPSEKPFRHPNDERIQVVSNDPRAPGVTRSTVFWHTDQSFKPSPSPVIVLSAAVLPDPGGATMFADMRAAYDSLSKVGKASIKGLKARHCFGALLGAAALTAATSGGSVHPLVRRHPVTGRRSLYLNQFSLESVVGVARQRAMPMLRKLYAHALKPEFVHTHWWTPRDVLVWDNLSLMHRAADLPAALRVLHRTHTRRARG
jgi:taurine dioxygenase